MLSFIFLENTKQKLKKPLIIKYKFNIILSQTKTLSKKKQIIPKQINTILSQIIISFGIWIHEGQNKEKRLTHEDVTSFIYCFSSKNIKRTNGFIGFRESSFSRVMFYGSTVLRSACAWIIWMLEVVDHHLNLQYFMLVINVTKCFTKAWWNTGKFN